MRSGVTIGPCSALVATIILALALPNVAPANERDTIREAIDQAVARIATNLHEAAGEKVKRIAVIQLRGDADNYATDGLKTALAKAGYELFTRDDETYNMLLKEIGWQERHEDAIDKDTLKKFGDIKGIDAIVSGVLRDTGVNMWSIRGQATVYAEMGNVETLQTWPGGNVQADGYIHWSDAVVRFWRYPLALIVILFVLIGLAFGLRKLQKAFKPI